MEWEKRNLDDLEAIDLLKLNPNQMKFYKTMVKFASIGVLPSKKQLIYLHFLAQGQKKESKSNMTSLLDSSHPTTDTRQI